MHVPHEINHVPISMSLGLKKFMRFRPNTLDIIHEPKRLLGRLGEKMIKHYENCELKAYKDIAGVWTIGYGNTFYENGLPVREDDEITQERADSLFWNIVKIFSIGVEEEVQSLDLEQYEFDALVSFAYNVGIDAFIDSTLLEIIKNDKHNYEKITYQWLRWRYSKGRVIKGLINRRETGANLYRTGSLNF